MNMMEEAARRVAKTAGAAEQVSQAGVYHSRAECATENAVQQAAEVLLLLAFFPMSMTGRVGFTALLERRIKRAYTGGTE